MKFQAYQTFFRTISARLNRSRRVWRHAIVLAFLLWPACGRSLSYIGPSVWNKLPSSIKRNISLNKFTHYIKKTFFTRIKYTILLWLSSNTFILVIITIIIVIHYSYVTFIFLLLLFSLILSLSLSLLLLLSVLLLSLYLRLPSISSTKVLLIAFCLGNCSENKAYINKMVLLIFYIKYINFTIYLFIYFFFLIKN